MNRKLIGLLIAVVVGLAVLAASASASTETVPSRWKNCTVVNKLYPHGIGKLHAHDKTTGRPVTNLWRSTVLYLAGMQINRGIDRDKDGIACEKH